MTKIMTNYDLINRMKELLNEPNYYGSGGSNWSSFINGGWYVDCTCSIKAILWGGRFIKENRGKPHAGCNYLSNGVPDFTFESLITKPALCFFTCLTIFACDSIDCEP